MLRETCLLGENMVQVRRFMTLWLSVLLLCSCGVSPTLQNATGGTVTTLVLGQAVTIPADKGRITFQGGQLVDSYNHLEAYCQLRSNKVSAQAQRILPDRFAISSVARMRSRDDVLEMPVIQPRISLSCSEQLYYTTRLRLHSALQPDVAELICREAFADCTAGRYPAVDTIESASGGTLRLE